MCLDGKVRDKDISDTGITPTELLIFGRTHEATTQQSKAMVHPITTSTVHAMEMSYNNNYKRGAATHSCSTWGKTCHMCGKLNHFASVCCATATHKQTTNYVEPQPQDVSGESEHAVQHLYDKYKHLSLYLTSLNHVSVVVLLYPNSQ